MFIINDKATCCGCTACESICPIKCINMISDEEGFLYPKVDLDKCLKCDKCKRVCPINNPIKHNDKGIAYTVQNKNSKILNDSTSGGAFNEIACYTIDKGGIVYGASYDKSFNVCHTYADNKDEIKRFRGSKYVQSNLEDCFQQTKKFLEKEILVCFSGTPCQISGLKSYLNKEYKNLITVDVVCHGVSSPKLWRMYLDYQLNKYKSNIKNISFRKKTYGYHSGTMEITFDNGKIYQESPRTDYMLKSFFSEVSSRPICYSCPFKNTKRVSDFTLFDCWHLSNLVNGAKDNDKGWTNLFVNSSIGLKIFNEIQKNLVYYDVNFDQAVKFDGSMVIKSAIPNLHRKDFYGNLNSNGLEETVEKIIPIRKFDFLIERSKNILYKTGLLNIIKLIRNK